MKNSDVDSAHPPGAQSWKGAAVRSLRSYVSWVQYAVKQYPLYPQCNERLLQIFYLVRKDWKKGTSGHPVE